MMSAKSAIRTMILGVAAVVLSAMAHPATAPVQAASEVKAVVNKTPITSDDIVRRVKFLSLQRQTGNLQQKAKDQLVEEVLKREEILRMKMSVSTEDVDKAFTRFAASNKLSDAQMTQILEKAGVGSDHFKQFIAVQMSWPRLVNARYGNRGKLSNQELVTRMQQNKPETTEYFLQQIIFVVPAAQRNAIMGKRQAEANASRASYPGCEQAKVFAATMRDVSVRDLGRILAPELPTDWKPLIEGIKGTTTTTRVTEKGVEYLAICKQRQVNDDVAAEAVFRAEDLGKQEGGENPNDRKYLDELRKKAQIVFL